MSQVGRVAELWRYPVKGLLGEQLPRLDVDQRGVVGDRQFSVRAGDGKFASNKTTTRFRRMPGLMSMRSTTVDGSVRVQFDDGRSGEVADGDTAARVSAIVGEDISLAVEAEIPHFDAAPIHVLTTASLAWLQARLPDDTIDRRRFRPNLLVDCPGNDRVEEDWVGRELVIGGTRLGVLRRVIRCVTTSLAQEDLAFAPRIPGELERANDACLGVYVSVLAAGTINAGDTVTLA
jgi:uncharacterized protein YcbX